jgi:hypothetical protein
MKLLKCLIPLLLLLLLAQPAFSAERKGVQVVGLSKMSAVSVRNCAAAIKESGCTTIEFAFMPFFNAANPFNNVDTLLDIPDVSKVETIFLSWRDESVMQGLWTNSLAVLRTRAQSVDAHIRTIRSKVSKVILIPMLEDNRTQAEWLQAVHTIAGELESGEKVYFRRSQMVGREVPPPSIETTLKNGVPYLFQATRLEAHRIDHGGPAQVISNDGGFVYQDIAIGGKYEDAASWPKAPGGYRTLSAWTADANTTTKVSILWRPSYNLFTRTETDNHLQYTRVGTLDQRTDSDTDPAFNAFEKEVLKAFLK